jgi:hypothetical protein
MNKVGTSALAVGLLGIAGAGGWGSGCSAKKPTELVPGVFSQVQVPRDLVSVRVDVRANGEPKFCESYDVTNGTAILPATLGVVAESSPASTTVVVEIRGYDATGAGQMDEAGCQSAPVNATAAQGGPGPRVLRRSIQTFAEGHILFLPMPLSYSCFDQDCSVGAALTCKGAQCVDALTPTDKLVDFDPALIDGTQDCFSPKDCFREAVSPVLVDPNTCIYGFPPNPNAGDGLNVRVFYQDVDWKLNASTGGYEPQVRPTSEQEILDLEDTEGFTVLANEQFQLSKGLCSLVNASQTPPPSPAAGGAPSYRSIVNVIASTACPPKTQLYPICRSDRASTALTVDGGTTTEVTCNVPMALTPVPSAIYMVMDDSHEMNGAFGKTGYATAMNLSLSAPVFKRTFVGFQFLKHDPADCTSANPSAFVPDIDFGLPVSTQPKVASKLLGWMDPGVEPLYLEAAMRPEGAYKRLSEFATGLGEPLNMSAVMFFVNRTPQSPVAAGGSDDGGAEGGTPPDAGDDGGIADAGGLGPMFGLDCPQASGADPTSAASAAIKAAVKAAYAGTPSVYTYFVVLDNNQHQSPFAFFQDVQNTTSAATAIDATSADPNMVLANFASTVTSIGTCLYELPLGVDSSASLKFTNPVSPQTNGPLDIPIPYAAACNAATAGTANGWNIDQNHIRVCGSWCDAIKGAVLFVTKMALQQGAQSDAGALIPEVPVSAEMSCVTK